MSLVASGSANDVSTARSSWCEARARGTGLPGCPHQAVTQRRVAASRVRHDRDSGWQTVPVTCSDAELYDRSVRTLLACWGHIASGSADARVEHLPGVAIAVFPTGPERAVYNNAVVSEELSAVERRTTLDAVEGTYDAAGIDGYTVWVREQHSAMAGLLVDRGFRIQESTRAMGLTLDELAVLPPAADVDPVEPSVHLRLIGVPDLWVAADPEPFKACVVRSGPLEVATAVAFDCLGDCGIFNVVTIPSARRRGFASALTTAMLTAAVTRGCTTASLQATPMAEKLYAAAGFRDLGRFIEYARSLS